MSGFQPGLRGVEGKQASRSRRASGFLTPWAALVLLHAFVATAHSAPSYYKVLQVNAGQVTGGPHADFPLLFNTTDPVLRTTGNGGRVTSASGWDIIFATSPTCADSTSCGGRKLDHEIESYNPATGELVAWVRLPSIADGTVVYVHYGDAAVSATTENRSGVWSSGYRGVWHLRETPAGAAGEVKDSTVNANHGTGEVPGNFPAQAAGQIAGSLSFTGTLDRAVGVADNASIRLVDLTVSGWARTASVDAQARLIVSRWNASSSSANYWLGKLDAANMAFGVHSGGVANTVYAPLGLVNNNAWHYVVGVVDSATASLRLYVDGVQAGAKTYPGPVQTGTSDLKIGRSSDTALQDWSGGIDEVRVGGVARSAGWIETEYRNQGSPSTFYSLAAMAAYRSVGVTATNLNTGSRTLEIVGNTATFSGAMPANVGVGDVLQYQVGAPYYLAFVSARVTDTVYTVQSAAGGTAPGRGGGHHGRRLPLLHLALQVGSPERERHARRFRRELRHVHEPRRRRQGDERRVLWRRRRHDGGRGERLDDGAGPLHPHLHAQVRSPRWGRASVTPAGGTAAGTGWRRGSTPWPSPTTTSASRACRSM